VASSADKYTAYDPNAPLDEGPGPIGYVALVLAWAVPGLGHFLIGQKARGFLFMICIHGLFAAGLLIGGIRVINPPDQPIWTYTQFLSGWPMFVANRVEKSSRLELGDHTLSPQSYPQQYKGALITQFEQQAPEHRPNETPNQYLARLQAYSVVYIQNHPSFAFHPKIQDVGSVYCGIAGMLNLLVIFDVLLRITGSKREQPGAKPAPESLAPTPAPAPMPAPAPPAQSSPAPKPEGAP
jgi:hypothetical protein